METAHKAAVVRWKMSALSTVDSQITLSIYQAFEAHELSRILLANLGIQIFFPITGKVNDSGKYGIYSQVKFKRQARWRHLFEEN